MQNQNGLRSCPHQTGGRLPSFCVIRRLSAALEGALVPQDFNQDVNSFLSAWLIAFGLYSGMHLDQVHPRPQTLDPAFTKMYWIELNRAISSIRNPINCQEKYSWHHAAQSISAIAPWGIFSNGFTAIHQSNPNRGNPQTQSIAPNQYIPKSQESEC